MLSSQPMQINLEQPNVSIWEWADNGYFTLYPHTTPSYTHLENYKMDYFLSFPYL